MGKMKKAVKMIIAVVVLTALLGGSALAASYGAQVLMPSMKVYGLSGSKKVVLGQLKQGTDFTVTEISGDWARISYKGKTGYAKLEDIIFDDSIKAVASEDTTIKFVTRESYSESKYYKATLAAGTTVYVVGKKGSYALVSNASGSALGYVKASKLTRG